MKSNARRLVSATAALAVVMTFLLVTLPTLHMHPDEELSYRATNGSLSDTLNWQISLQDNQAPLWFVTFNLWRSAVGDSEFAARVLGVLFVMPALALSCQIARRGFASAAVGSFALLALVGNHLFFNYALDIRPYPLVMLVAACSTFALQTWLLRPTRRAASIYGVSLALLLYTHYLLILLAAAHVIYTLCSTRVTARRFGQALLAGFVGVALWLPWLPVFVSHVDLLRRIEAESGTARGVAGIGVSTLATTPENIGRLIDAATNGLWVLYGVVLFAGAVIFMRRRAYWLALTWAVLTPALYLLANLIAAVYAPRFVSHALLGGGIAVGAVLAHMPVRWRGLPVRFGAMALWMVAHLAAFPSQPTIPPRVPIRDVYAAINANAQPNDVMLFVRGGEGDPYMDFMNRTYLAPYLNDAATADQDAARLARRVWFVTGDWFHDDVRAAFAALERTHPLQHVIGDCTRAYCFLAQLMQAPPNRAPVIFGGELPFYGADIERIDGGHVRVRLWWKADSPPSLDYSIGVHVLNADGALVAQNDGAIQHYGEHVVQTSAMTLGQIYIDIRMLTLPPSPPRDELSLVLVVYRSWDSVRLTLPDGTTHLQLARISP